MAETETIKTERLILRAPIATDADEITTRIGVKAVAWNLGRAPYPYARSDAEGFITKARENWANDTAYVFVAEYAGEGVIGCVGLDLHGDDIWEIGYWIGQPWWGQGFVSEAATAVMDWGKAKGMEKFVSGHFVDNPASGRVLEKLGFVPVGIVDHIGAARGGPSPAQRYVLGASPQDALRTASH